MKISVIIPTLQEESCLPRLLSQLKESNDEVIVVDGGSTDATVDVARQFSASIVHAPPGRGIQMNAGAAVATGDLFWFLHADTIVPADWRAQILRRMSDPQVVGGAFRVVINARGIRYRFLDAWGWCRTRLQRIFYGDQGIFVRQKCFETLGGFNDRPILEDLDFSARLSKTGKVVILPGPLKTSARRWETHGWWRTVLDHSQWALSHIFSPSAGSAIHLIVMAKAPIPGKVKTRLMPVLSAEQAAQIARQLLLEMVTLVRNLGGLQPFVAVAPAEKLDDVRQLLGFPAIRLIPQPPGDLGEKLSLLFQRAFAAGAAGVIGLGTDHPNLPKEYLLQAVAALKSRRDQIVVGPTDDGGYYLIGMNRFHPALFQQIPWSTSEVLEATVRQAKKENCAIHRLPPWYDIDRPEDLARLPERFAVRYNEGRKLLKKNGKSE